MSNILGIGTSALLSFQRKLDTISHNIAHVNTKGYSRQTTSLVARDPVTIGGQMIGAGVKAGLTERAHDEVINEVMRNNLSNEAEYTSYLDIVNRMNTLLSDGNTGVSEAINQFFASIQNLSNDPGSIPSRQVFLNNSDLLVKRFQSLDQQIDQEFLDINNQTKNLVLQLNAHTSNLVNLNRNILDASSNQADANDMEDARDQVLEDISKIIDISIVKQGDGMVNVYMGKGQALVIGTQQTVLKTQVDSDDPKKVDVFSSDRSGDIEITESISGGQLGALKRVRTEVLDKVQRELGRLALTIAGTFNDQHKKGLDLNGELGGFLFKDINNSTDAVNRAFADTKNTGTAVLGVLIDEIPRVVPGPHTVDSTPGSLAVTGTLTALTASGQLQLNNVAIRATVSTDDTLSPAGDALASALATAAAINESTGVHGVTATAEATHLYLGSFTAGAFAGIDFQINGQTILTTGVDVETLQRDINARQDTTGVEAFLDENKNLSLVAADGRNIQIDTTGNSASGATFSHFATTGGGGSLSSVQRATVRLQTTHQEITIGGTIPSNIGFTAGRTPSQASALTVDEYTLSYDGSLYTLTRQSDSVIVAQDALLTNIQADGFSLQLNSGSMVTGDRFVLRPTRDASGNIQLNLRDVNKLAMGFAVRGEAEYTNKGTGIMRSEKIQIHNTTGLPAPTATKLGNAFGLKGQLTPPLLIQFDTSTTYRVFDITKGQPGVQIGPVQTFSPNQENHLFPMSSVLEKTGAPTEPYTYDPGYTVVLEGEPQKGDKFTIVFNKDANGDSRNAKEFVKMQEENILLGGTATYQQTYSILITDIGAVTNQSMINSEAAESLVKQTELRKQSLVGVNLDEEAANLIRYQQSYQAAAQLITVERDIFSDLLAALRR